MLIAGHATDPRVAGRRARLSPSTRTASNGRDGRTSRCPLFARAITGTRWNGWVFFGLKNREGADMTKPMRPETASARSTRANPPRKGWSRSSTACMPSERPARRTSPASAPRAGCWSRDQYDDGRHFSGGTLERPGLKRLLEDIEEWAGVDVGWWSTNDPPQPVASAEFRQAGRNF